MNAFEPFYDRANITPYILKAHGEWSGRVLSARGATELAVVPLARIAFLLDGNGEIVGIPGARVLTRESDSLCAGEIGCRDRHLQMRIVNKGGVPY